MTSGTVFRPRERLALALGVQLGELAGVDANALHVREHEVDLLQGAGHDVDKVVGDGLEDGLGCLLLLRCHAVCC